MNGKFIISLDFELHWGVFDALSLDQYQNNLNNVKGIIDRLIILSDKYGVKLTFATVGLLFADSKDEIRKYLPAKLPQYSDPKLNPYRLIDEIGENESTDTIHYAKSIIKKIVLNGNHEISTHTFGHYNCLEAGQSIDEFSEDLIAAKKIANDMNIEINSIVFPKNQVTKEYLGACRQNGIISYRGTENYFLYDVKLLQKRKIIRKLYRLIRFMDGYINISGFNTYPINSLKKDESGLINLPSSRFLRPFIPKLYFLESLKCLRIRKAMRYAALNNELFHLWWHPHNFGSNIEENFYNLESIFKEYALLNEKYNFKSATMTELTNEILKENINI
ncbi:polysaccharide deacetylase [Mariniflexile sp. HMF6888]|uniref:polysaccharide deacetylase n=1 Tax=Mariniflexile sp. HMF6888 TaxID=3373086 RepID=UPI0037A376E7